MAGYTIYTAEEKTNYEDFCENKAEERWELIKCPLLDEDVEFHFKRGLGDSGAIYDNDSGIVKCSTLGVEPSERGDRLNRVEKSFCYRIDFDEDEDKGCFIKRSTE